MLSSRNPWQLREIASLENVCWSCFLRGGRNTRSLVTNAALGNGFMHRNESRRSRTTIKRKPSAFPVSHLSNRKFCTKLNGRVVRSRNRTGSATQQKVSPPLQDQREFSNGRTDLERSRNSLTTIRTSAPFGLRHGASTIPTGLRASSTLPCISKHLSESGTHRFRFGPQSRTKTTHMSQASTVSHQESPIHSGDLLPHTPSPISRTGSTRNDLRLWELQHKKTEEGADVETLGITGDIQNRFTLAAKRDGIVDALYEADEENNLDLHNDGIDENYQASNVHLHRGDLVEISYRPASLGIFVRLIGNEVQFLSMEGKIAARTRSTVFYFSVPHFVPRSEVDPLLPYFPDSILEEEDPDKRKLLTDNSIPSELTASLLKAMSDFKTSTDDIYRKHAETLDNAYETLAKNDTTHKTTTEITKALLGDSALPEINKPALWAVHRSLDQGELGFRMDLKNHRRTEKFEILGKHRIAQFRQVQKWVREYQESTVTGANNSLPAQNPIPRFIKRARILIQESRKHRELTNQGRIGPTTTNSDSKSTTRFTGDRRLNLHGFLSDEKILIDFLLAWCAQRHFKLGTSFSSVGPILVRAVGLYDDFELDQAAAFTLLQELGVVAPWELAGHFNPSLALQDYITDPHNAKRTETLKSEASRRSQSLDEKDVMRSFRRDWGEADVFCIDDLGASEIDDGISLESISNNNMEYWVHIHVANPTAFFSPRHPLGKYAAQEMNNIYLREKTYTMLMEIAQQFSLDRGKPTLTFSARLNTSGEILASKIAPGIIRNVHHITPKMVSKVLRRVKTDETPDPRLTVGGNVPEEPSPDPVEVKFTKSQVDTLRQLHRLANARRSHYRTRVMDTGRFTLNRSDPVSIIPKHLANGHAPQKLKRLDHDPIISFKSLPTLDLSVKECIPKDNAPVEDFDIVSPLMVLACEVAASWCSQRNIPVFYRGVIPHIDAEKGPKKQTQFTDEAVAAYFATVSERSFLGKVVLQDTPIPHSFLGIDAYVQTTSPLRRYGDMVAHWQIESALRYEALTGKSLIDNPNHDDFALAISRDEIKAKVLAYDTRCKEIYIAQQDSNLHWLLQLLFRAHYFMEGELPKTWRVFVTGHLTRPYGHGCRGQGVISELSQWGLLRDNEATREAGGMHKGDWWECALSDVNVFWRRIIMKPLRLIERTAIIDEHEPLRKPSMLDGWRTITGQEIGKMVT